MSLPLYEHSLMMTLKSQASSNSYSRRLFTGGAWALWGKIITALATLTINAMLARLLAPNEMGVFFLSFSFVTIATQFALMGMNQTILRLIAESVGTGLINRALQGIKIPLILAAGGVLLVSIGIVGGIGNIIADRILYSTILKDLLLLIAIWVAILTFQQILSDIYRGFHDIRFASIFGGLVTNVLCAIIFSALHVLKIECMLEDVILLTILTGTISLLFSGLVLYKKLRKHILRTNQTPKQYFSYRKIVEIAFPVWISNLALIPRIQAAIWILGMYRSQSEVATFGASLRLVTLVSMTLIIVNSVLPPIIAELSIQKRKSELEVIIRSSTAFAAIPTIFILAIYIIWGKEILGLVFGHFYRSGYVVLCLLSIGQLFNVCCGSCGQTLIMTGHQKILMYVSVLTGVFTIAFSVVFVKHHGAVGAASVVMANMIFYNILLVIIAKSKVGVWTFLTFKPKLSSFEKITIK